MKAWYLLRCKSRQDERAEINLINQNYDVFRPIACVSKSRGGFSKEAYEPLFPGYIFIYLDPSNDNWARIRSTRGVNDFVRFATLPPKVDTSVVKEIQERLTLIQERWCVDLRRHLTPGDRIKVNIEGLQSIEAVFSSYSPEERVNILINVLGRLSNLEVELKYIELV
ncbi:transcription/translation regulatory transformer protein RfaH [Hahella sp. KA22]|uniref:transcription termination/antitermination NusG family protein n=1 Tax=Hahella sp. KA22 TaxID=1628392 RepID=UPI000FDF3CC6|nr:transcription termination/antitermination NusG family protein [Hahella sp. KA22]AZZ91657.1 transcription/translation regulatory transformer protein RfaH [Hahella sp. KA22]QAY55027.1 transcription/translation regulatory transformer protein RfaH [Hahella sp. KA22]